MGRIVPSLGRVAVAVIRVLLPWKIELVVKVDRVVGLLGVQPALELAAGLTLSGRPSRVAPVSRLSRPPAPLGWFSGGGSFIQLCVRQSLVSLSVCSLSGPEVWGRGVGWFWPRPLFGLGWR